MSYKKQLVHEIDILSSSDGDLIKVSNELMVGLSLDEMKLIKGYFSDKGRNPKDIELQALGQAWSEHCCYKSSKNVLQEFIFGIDAPQNILVISEDAGVVEFDEEHAYVVALESHNHPSAIEPYGGAATGIGGIVRDVVCMGAQPVAFIDPLFFGSLNFDKSLPPGVKHPKYLFSGVVSGISDYGNRIGIPTTTGMVYFDDGYIGNCLVNVGCVGIIRKDKIARSSVKKAGDIFVLVGGKTGRDGVHGVTFASSELTDSSEEESMGAVQLGDPITKEPLIHACLLANEQGLLDGMKDLGGGGLSCVVGEMALAGGFGAEVSLDNVPLKQEGLLPWEIWVSESQERFMLAVDEKNLDKVLSIFELWDIDATVIGRSVPEKTLRVFYKDEKILELELEFLTKGPLYNRACEVKSKFKQKKEDTPDFREPKDYNKTILGLLASENIASKEWVIRQFDHEVRASTVIGPLQGKISHVTHGDATVIKPLERSYRGLALTSDVNPSYMKIDPYWGAASAIDEVCRNLCAVSAVPHSFADCLNFGNPEKADRFGDFYEACAGLSFVAKSLGVPFVSGNVSFYNELSDPIPPTPTILGVGIVPDVRKCITSDAKREGSLLYVMGETKCEIGGSEYSKFIKMPGGAVPRVNPEALKKRMEVLLEIMQKGPVLACHDVSDGGLAVCVAEMLIGGGYGAQIDISCLGDQRSDIKLFSESNTRWVIEVEKSRMDSFEDFLGGVDVPFFKIGKIKGNDFSVSDGKNILIDIPMRDVKNAWKNTIYECMW